MDKETAVSSLTDVMAKFTAYIGKRLPRDVKEKTAKLRAAETNPLAIAVYDSMADNQEYADKLNRPSCQDTGVIQYFVSAGARFPLLGEMEGILENATKEATIQGPLRHNAVETFIEKIPAPTPVRKSRGWTGRSFPMPITALSMCTWPVAAAPCQVRPRC